MPTPTMLIATWDNGVFSVVDGKLEQELHGQPVRSLVSDGRDGVLAIVDSHSVRRRSPDGAWSIVAESDAALSCCVPIGTSVFVGTDDARILRVEADRTVEWLTGFDAVAGRDTWYAGAAIVDGRLLGPPLGIRSIAATLDSTALLANVHVGGIPRSTDGGKSWAPTIDIEADVHQVCAHPSRPEIVIAAAAVGLCISRDAGATWKVEDRGLHAPHCSAVAFGRHDLYVSASTDPFAAEGAIYRRPIDGDGPLEKLTGGMPDWTNGKADTDCIAAGGATVALIDWAGHLYVSEDDGASWQLLLEGPAGPSALHIC